MYFDSPLDLTWDLRLETWVDLVGRSSFHFLIIVIDIVIPVLVLDVSSTCCLWVWPTAYNSQVKPSQARTRKGENPGCNQIKFNGLESFLTPDQHRWKMMRDINTLHIHTYTHNTHSLFLLSFSNLFHSFSSILFVFSSSTPHSHALDAR